MNITTETVSAVPTPIPVSVPAEDFRKDARSEALHRRQAGAGQPGLKSFPIRWQFRRQLQQPPVTVV